MANICTECKLEVSDKDALISHWEEQLDKRSGHYHCRECVILFHTRQDSFRHHHQHHPAKQDLACPGCGARFELASGVINHIEKNRCPKIKNDDLIAQREKKLAFARELQRRHRGGITEAPEDISLATLKLAQTAVSNQGPFNFTPSLSGARYVPDSGPSLSSLRPKAENTTRPDPVTFAIQQPEISNDQDDEKKQPVGNKWGQNPTPAPSTAARPLAKQPEAVQQPSKNKATAYSPHDPGNPEWKATDYFVPVISKYKCPHSGCAKSFPTPSGLRTHLLSAAHSSQPKVQCPSCSKWFDTMTAVMQHAESQGTRCRLRRTNGYRQFLDQLTGGIVDTAGKNADGTLRFAVTSEAREVFGGKQATKKVDGKEEVKDLGGKSDEMWEGDVWDSKGQEDTKKYDWW